MKLSKLITSDREFREYSKLMKSNISVKDHLPIIANGLSGGAADVFLAESIKVALETTKTPILVLVPSESEREATVAMLASEGVEALPYKPRDLVFYNIKASHDVDRERLSVLSSILSGRAKCIVTTPDAALQITMPKDTLKNLSISIAIGEEHSPEELSKKLTSLGFARCDIVDGKGQFSRRGDIFDFWCGESENPVRIEFFGDEVDRLTSFDPISQRTVSMLDDISLLPAAEVLVSEEARDRIGKCLDSLIESQKDQSYRERLTRERGVITAGGSIDFRDKFLGLIYPEEECLLDYLGGGGIAFILGTNECRDNEVKMRSHLAGEADNYVKSGLITKDCVSYFAKEKVLKSYENANQTVHINPFSGGFTERLTGLFGFRTRTSISYGDTPSLLIEDLKSYQKGYYRIIIACENEAGLESVREMLTNESFACRALSGEEFPGVGELEDGLIYLTISDLRGFDLINSKVALVSMKRDTGRAIMRRKKQQRLIKKLGGSGERLLSYADLSVGDYIVHANYGIGLFLGIETVTALGVTKDYIAIQYAGTDKLQVPCDKLDMIGKYIGDRDKDGKVKLSKMGGTEWAKTKSRAKSAAKNIAKHLIELYAKRKNSPGVAYGEDTDMELSFAYNFMFEETDSQIRAINEIKEDMMRPCPMNRLLCGDVGFGKTEVALRAAFKAIMGGKQVAILVPTTILAFQHYQTAISRFRGYPVTIEMLTRFKKPKEQAEILRKVKRGEVDILIGTHKLFSKNVEFRDLGLLVVDEEQRFGVAQKEKLKEFFVGVDVLTLTATPIPRTLNMAMNGISDISILDEAPEERHPVQTYVMEHDNAIIYDAIRRELSRGGQVLYLYNKVETIEFVADTIQAEIPEARVAFGHGQMDKEELEDVWQMLVRGELDILVCTTIIETGVDLPNANTLIIEDADKFGLSQLHQIRGRVGRSERQAYAYFTYRPGKSLSEFAERRLEAIREFAEFGAGFKIALRDLEIRGAGNLLGAEQHGYIDAVGYDLYCKILNEAILEEKGEFKPKPEEAFIDMKISAHIPSTYIPSEAERMEMYKKISLIRTDEDRVDVEDELCDRFGDMPKVTERLLLVAATRAMATEVGITKASVTESMMTFKTSGIDLALWSEIFAKYPGMRFSPGDPTIVLYRFAKAEPPKLLYDIVSLAYNTKMNDKKSEKK